MCDRVCWILKGFELRPANLPGMPRPLTSLSEASLREKLFADSCHAILPLKSRPLIFLWKPRLVLFLLLLLFPLLLRGNYHLTSDQWRLNFWMLKEKYVLFVIVLVFVFLNCVKREKYCRESKKYLNIYSRLLFCFYL